ncbi:N5-carboxyaminoimidazole ribonucleotide mutase [hydrothermal vent metagenome]|uniref:N5-carboxyaminoimidazole ribonucleotide mutase n=1 Tax=hydrothermal vent metagenome TaxID=652676 RepID=A0A3B0VCH0_9ZZZZ
MTKTTARAKSKKPAPRVLILMGSDSDLPVMEEASKVFDGFGVPYEMTVSSAHRTPERTLKIAGGAEKRGIKIIIAGAGAAAHLAGFIASKTTLPVIGVPIDATPMRGLDALLATVQMPGGIPVATMAIGKAGARNAGLFASEILALSDKRLAQKLKRDRQAQARKVEAKAKNLNKER